MFPADRNVLGAPVYVKVFAAGGDLQVARVLPLQPADERPHQLGGQVRVLPGRLLRKNAVKPVLRLVHIKWKQKKEKRFYLEMGMQTISN